MVRRAGWLTGVIVMALLTSSCVHPVPLPWGRPEPVSPLLWPAAQPMVASVAVDLAAYPTATEQCRDLTGYQEALITALVNLLPDDLPRTTDSHEYARKIAHLYPAIFERGSGWSIDLVFAGHKHSWLAILPQLACSEDGAPYRTAWQSVVIQRTEVYHVAYGVHDVTYDRGWLAYTDRLTEEDDDPQIVYLVAIYPLGVTPDDDVPWGSRPVITLEIEGGALWPWPLIIGEPSHGLHLHYTQLRTTMHPLCEPLASQQYILSFVDMSVAYRYEGKADYTLTQIYEYSWGPEWFWEWILYRDGSWFDPASYYMMSMYDYCDSD